MKRFFNALLSKFFNHTDHTLTKASGIASETEKNNLAYFNEIRQSLSPGRRGWIHVRTRGLFLPSKAPEADSLGVSKTDIPGVLKTHGPDGGEERPETYSLPDASSDLPSPNKPSPKKKPQKPQWNLTQFDVPPSEGETRFHDLELPLPIMHAVCDLGFKYCTPVQAAVIPHALSGRDATGRAQTGTGKSAAFLIAIIAKLMDQSRGKPQKGAPRALILAPTRELVIQIEKDAKALGKYTPLRTLAVFGGTGYKHQQDILENRYVDIVAATPGRLIDFMGQKVLNLKKVDILVLDEADRMLDMGFLPDIRKIVYATPHKDRRQTMFFSATFTDEILRLAAQWTKDAVRIEVDPEHAASENINQKVFIVTENEKMPLLYNLIVGNDLDRVILFVNRRDTTRRLAKKLSQYGISNGVLSGEVSQNQRMRTLEHFKQGKLTVLVATDVAARGLHIEGVSHVINYDLPHEAEHYVHRIGRTGRAGAQGISVSFADEMSSFHIPDIEAVLGEKLACEYPEEALLKPLPKPKPLSDDEKAGDDEGKKGVKRGGRDRSRNQRNNKSNKTDSSKKSAKPQRRRPSPSSRHRPRRRRSPNATSRDGAVKQASSEKSGSES